MDLVFKNAHGVLLADSRNLGPSTSNGDQFRCDFLAFSCGFAPHVFFRNLQPQSDGFPNVAQCFFAGLALAPAAGEGRATDRKTFIRFYQQNFVFPADIRQHNAPGEP